MKFWCGLLKQYWYLWTHLFQEYTLTFALIIHNNNNIIILIVVWTAWQIKSTTISIQNILSKLYQNGLFIAYLLLINKIFCHNKNIHLKTHVTSDFISWISFFLNGLHLILLGISKNTLHIINWISCCLILHKCCSPSLSKNRPI